MYEWTVLQRLVSTITLIKSYPHVMYCQRYSTVKHVQDPDTQELITQYKRETIKPVRENLRVLLNHGGILLWRTPSDYQWLRLPESSEGEQQKTICRTPRLEHAVDE